MSFSEAATFVAETIFSQQPTFDHSPRQAYDITRDVIRYGELRQTYSDPESRKILLEEMTADLMTHFAELNRVGGFSYRYRISNEILVEDSQAEKPIVDMFKDQDGVVARLWQESIIPTLELMPVNATVFTYSARQNGTFEGGYDYAYVFQKIDKNTIHCNGLELVLSRFEQAAVLNQLYQESNKFHLLLTDNPDGDEVRSRAFYFPPGKYESIARAYAQIIGKVIKPLRSGWTLETSSDYKKYLNEQDQKLLLQQSRSEKLAASIVDDLDRVPLAVQKLKLANEQKRDLWRLYPQLMIRAATEGLDQILLPCGSVDVSSGLNMGDLRFTAGNGLVETANSIMKCVTCPFCKKIVDAVVTSSTIECPECHAKVEKS
jgi:hypothetical protein